MRRNGENEILTMNQSELHSTPPEYLSRTEGRWRCETHTSPWRVGGAMLLLLRSTFYCWGWDADWSNLLHSCVSSCRNQQDSSVLIIWWGIHTCVLPLSYFSLCFGPNQVRLVYAGVSQTAHPLTACITLVFLWCSQLKDHLLIKNGARIVRQGFSQANRNKQVTVFFFVVLLSWGSRCIENRTKIICRLKWNLNWS